MHVYFHADLKKEASRKKDLTQQASNMLPKRKPL